MSQIYNGSFVLGDTSATTLSAGPGIKLDTSVPGTIKISNDETVLWSGQQFVSATNFPLSENYYNFQSIKIFTCRGYEYRSPIANEYEVNSTGTRSITISNLFNDATYLNIDYATCNLSGANLTVTDWKRKAFAASNFSTSTSAPLEITKIVGINRISGNA